MRRKLFSFASAASLPLCVATAVLWVRSYSTGDALVLAPQRWPLQSFLIATGYGTIGFGWCGFVDLRAAAKLHRRVGIHCEEGAHLC